MFDTIEVIGNGTLIQHGKQNDRIYLMKLDEKDMPSVLGMMAELAQKNNYSKIFCKIPGRAFPLFLADRYILEAIIPGLYNKKEDAFFVSKFPDPGRLQNIESVRLSDFSRLLSETSESSKRKASPPEFQSRRLGTADVEQITRIYREVFVSYPFPIHDPGYIIKTMNKHIQYYGAEREGKLVAVASSEIDTKGSNAEMTDFATSKKYLGNSLSVLLLGTMEKEMKKQGIKTLYTIARLNSIPMNKTFLRFNYTYSGTLVNNTNIAGQIESMNVYYKHL
ncbi:MAG: putative beta-lysine N-acetyltransferase [Bacteroidales bacterium]|nr:putative beta-lysine N-acetyltransferase [Bacteroidales bacterium]